MDTKTALLGTPTGVRPLEGICYMAVLLAISAAAEYYGKTGSLGAGLVFGLCYSAIAGIAAHLQGDQLMKRAMLGTFVALSITGGAYVAYLLRSA